MHGRPHNNAGGCEKPQLWGTCASALRSNGYGFATYPIRDDWNGGDMLARHMTDWECGVLTIQIKSRATFDRKYLNKNLWIGFPWEEGAYVYPHDEILTAYLRIRAARGQPLEASKAWASGGCVHWSKPTEELLNLLQPYKLWPERSDRFIISPGHLEISPAPAPPK
jgi:hypothetical protein